MKTIIGILISLALISAEANAVWRQKPILCESTEVVLDDFKNDGYQIVAESVLKKDMKDPDDAIVGSLLFLVKNQELFLIESYFANGISCIISVSMLKKQKNAF